MPRRRNRLWHRPSGRCFSAETPGRSPVPRILFVAPPFRAVFFRAETPGRSPVPRILSHAQQRTLRAPADEIWIEPQSAQSEEMRFQISNCRFQISIGKSIFHFALCTLTFALMVGCESIPRPTAEELKVRDQWAAVVSPETRRKVIAEIDRHTGWAEKRKVLFEIDQYQHVYREAERKARWEKAATQPATGPATRP